MARNRDSLEYMLSCQVCFEDFEEDGAHVPRILPCSHTLCESCINQLIQNKKLECPECRTTHPAGNQRNGKRFPQNNDRLVLVRCRKEESDGNEKCKEHGKELTVYCLKQSCRKPICISCLKTDHKGHDWTEIEEYQKEILMEDMKKPYFETFGIEQQLLPKIKHASQLKCKGTKSQKIL